MSDADELGVTFGVGTCPPEVREAVEAQAARQRIALPRPTTSEVESWFSDAAELIKRAGGSPRC